MPAELFEKYAKLSTELDMHLSRIAEIRQKMEKVTKKIHILVIPRQTKFIIGGRIIKAHSIISNINEDVYLHNSSPDVVQWLVDGGKTDRAIIDVSNTWNDIVNHPEIHEDFIENASEHIYDYVEKRITDLVWMWEQPFPEITPAVANDLRMIGEDPDDYDDPIELMNQIRSKYHIIDTCCQKNEVRRYY